MTDDMLQKLVEDTSLRYFKRPFTHRAFFNSRLRTTGGRYHLKTHHIDINKKVFDKYGYEELVGVIKHELCHYHLHLQQKGYRHQDEDFKRLLKQVGGIRYVKDVEEDKPYHVYWCPECDNEVFRKRKIDLDRSLCRCCRLPFIYVGTKVIEDDL